MSEDQPPTNEVHSVISSLPSPLSCAKFISSGHRIGCFLFRHVTQLTACPQNCKFHTPGSPLVVSPGLRLDCVQLHLLPDHTLICKVFFLDEPIPCPGCSAFQLSLGHCPHCGEPFHAHDPVGRPTYYMHHPTFQVPQPHLYYLRCPTGDVHSFDQPGIFQPLLDQTHLGALYTNALLRTELAQFLRSLPFDAKEELCDLIQHRIESFCCSNELDGFFLLLAEALRIFSSFNPSKLC
ncbi:MAG: hypothetical protein ACFFC7_12930 [Candidatus Hermodarchaeota archaeon]